jgi:hypothetical protein
LWKASEEDTGYGKERNIVAELLIGKNFYVCKGEDMDFQEIFDSLSDLGDYKVTITTGYDEDGCGDPVYAARIEVNGMTKGGLSYEGELEALSLAMDLVENNEDVSEHSGAAGVLKATLDELGFDKAVALLERLNRL